MDAGWEGCNGEAGQEGCKVDAGQMVVMFVPIRVNKKPYLELALAFPTKRGCCIGIGIDLTSQFEKEKDSGSTATKVTLNLCLNKHRIC